MTALRGKLIYAMGVAALLALGCGEPTPIATPIPSPAETLSPSAQPGTAKALLMDLATTRHASDGGGRAFLKAVAVFDGERGEQPTQLEAPYSVRAGSRARFDLVYEAGPLGVASGGVVFLQVSPFWGWDTPQTKVPDAPGFSEITTDAVGVELDIMTLAETLLGIEIKGRALHEGERITLRYGAGAAGARVDLYAEHESRIWFAVDGDGDGVRALVKDSPEINIHAGPPGRIIVTVPTATAPEETVSVRVAVVDQLGNAGPDFSGEFDLIAEAGLELPVKIEWNRANEDASEYARVVEARATQAGIFRIRVEGRSPYESLVGVSNPLVVSNTPQRVLWGDLHGHSNLSDGTGTPEQFMSYARNVAGLDIVALTDHDHWGMEFLDASPQHWERIRAATQSANDPGSFVTLLGFEWTSWLQGHRHVLYFGDEGEIISSIDSRTDTPDELWAALEGQPALTFAHHSAGGPIATNWAYAPNPNFEPVTEIVSVHGSSEAADSPGLIYAAVKGNFARDALDRGYELGFIGSGDSHDGHPGLGQLANSAGTAGLAAIISDDKSRAGVLAALRARRVYATNGQRISLRVSLDGAPMGSRLVGPPADAEHVVEIEVAGTAAIERVDLIRGGGGGPPAIESIQLQDTLEWQNRRRIPRLEDGQYFYVRVVQENGGVAWSSPIRAKRGES